MNRIQGSIYILSYPDLIAVYNQGINNDMPEQFAQLHWDNHGKYEYRRYPDNEYLCELLRYRRWGSPDPRIAKILVWLQRWTDSKSAEELKALGEQYNSIDAISIANERALAQEEDWWNRIVAQDWSHEFFSVPAGWTWNPREKVWHNRRNEMIKLHGTWDIYQYAIDQDILPGPDVRIKPDPSSREIDTSPAPNPKN